MSRSPLDVLTIGRVSVGLYPPPVVPLAEVQTFVEHIGGSSTEVAVAVARYGHRSAAITKVGGAVMPTEPQVREVLDGVA